MNASLFISSSAWPLAFKMEHTDFPAEPVGRLERLAPTEIAWFRSGATSGAGRDRDQRYDGGCDCEGCGECNLFVGSAGDATSDAISVAERLYGERPGHGLSQDRACVGNCGAACGQGARCIGETQREARTAEVAARVISPRWAGAEDFEQQEAGADDDAGVGDVEVGPVVVVDFHGEEVDDVVEADAVVEVAEGSAEDEGERDRGEGEVRPVRQSRAKTMRAAMMEKAMRPRRTPLGGRFSISEKAAPVLRTCERRKTPGMTGMS